MQIVGVMFTAPGACGYQRLANVWQYSARKAHPEAVVRLLRPPHLSQRSTHQERNQYKLEQWNRAVQTATENTILMDVDMLVLQEIAHVFQHDFDVCYTRRTKARMPLNGGLLFVKPTESAKRFFCDWTALDERFVTQCAEYRRYIRKYGGQNQASFGYMLEHYPCLCRIRSVPCTLYNVCQEEWGRVNSQTRVIHLKSSLKRICSATGADRPIQRRYERTIAMWKAMESEMKARIAGHENEAERETRLADDSTILDHAETPYHRGHAANSSCAHAERNAACGDWVRLELVLDEAGCVTEAWFQGGGCLISQAAASILCQAIEGRTVDELRNLTARQVLQWLEIPLTARRMQCGLLAFKVLKTMIYALAPRSGPELR